VHPGVLLLLGSAQPFEQPCSAGALAASQRRQLALDPLDVDLGVTSGAGGLCQPPQFPTALLGEAVVELVTEGAVAASEPAERDTKVVKRIGRAFVVEDIVCVARSRRRADPARQREARCSRRANGLSPAVMSGWLLVLTKPEKGELSDNERRDGGEQHRLGLGRCGDRSEPA